MTTLKENIIEDCKLMQQTLSDCTDLDKECKSLAEELETTEILIHKCIDENALKVQNQVEYLEKYEQLMRKYTKAKKKLDDIESETLRRHEQKTAIQAFIDTFQKQDTPPIEFDDDLWLTLVVRATINADESVAFKFKGGIEITEQM